MKKLHSSPPIVAAALLLMALIVTPIFAKPSTLRAVIQKQEEARITQRTKQEEEVRRKENQTDKRLKRGREERDEDVDNKVEKPRVRQKPDGKKLEEKQSEKKESGALGRENREVNEKQERKKSKQKDKDSELEEKKFERGKKAEPAETPTSQKSQRETEEDNLEDDDEDIEKPFRSQYGFRLSAKAGKVPIPVVRNDDFQAFFAEALQILEDLKHPKKSVVAKIASTVAFQIEAWCVSQEDDCEEELEDFKKLLKDRRLSSADIFEATKEFIDLFQEVKVEEEEEEEIEVEEEVGE